MTGMQASALNRYRRELRDMLNVLNVRRPAVVRRSMRDSFLYATDLPQAADPADTRKFIENILHSGWKVETDKGWIHLDPPGIQSWPDPDMKFPENPESECCLSILRRHPDGTAASAGTTERKLIKAAEEGPEAYARACAQIHAEWAEVLREHRKLPDIDPKFLGG